jgi:uncharacterized protein YndB with AHSA1/START domain
MTVETSNRLRLTRRFDAAPERVFAAWFDPPTVRQWLFAAPSSEPKHRIEIDARVGGSCVILNRWGGPDVIIGYLEIAAPRRLVFTLILPYFSPDSDHLTVEIAPAGAGCILTLIHEGPPPDYQSPIERGWAEMFDDLAATLR